VEIQKYAIEGLISFIPKVYEDERGHFFESFNQKFCDQFTDNASFVQDNQSLSKKGVLRGLHFQIPPFSQGKLVRVIKGAVLDVAVDIRQNSETYGQHVKLILNEQNGVNFWIPAGFAHGFLALEDETIFAYKCTNFYDSESEGALLWNDREIAIDWGAENPIVSSKDQEAGTFHEFKSPFQL
jgi:dTDP-4-dehydrorhamnose 3,5-epimerase